MKIRYRHPFIREPSDPYREEVHATMLALVASPESWARKHALRVFLDSCGYDLVDEPVGPPVTLTRDDYERLVEMADNAQDGTSDSTPYEKEAARAYVILRRAERRSR